MKKKIFITAIILVIAIFFIVVGLREKPAPQSPPKNSQPSAESIRCSLVSKNDSYEKPDFERLVLEISKHPIIEDIPKKGKISLRFFHITEGCRILDKRYMLTNGKIYEGSENADITITFSSDYVDRIDRNNFCEIIKEAIEKGDATQHSDLSKTTLFIKYRGLIKHAECLGIDLKI